MTLNRSYVTASNTAAIARLEPVLASWGFVYVFDGIRPSHCGPFASGHFSRGTTRIGLSCRDEIDNVYYEHEFIKQNLCSRETESFTIGHSMLMSALGHADDCWLVSSSEIPVMIKTREGIDCDRVDALLHDLKTIAFSVLQEPSEQFEAIMRLGWRSYNIE